MNKNTNNTGLGLGTVLTAIFVVLKLVGTIDWSWWWVLSPILIEIGLTIIILIGWAAYVAHEKKKYGFTTKKGKQDKWKF